MTESILDGIPIIDDNADCPLCVDPHAYPPFDRETANRELQCNNPMHTNPHPLELSAACHPTADLRVFYCTVHGTLAIFCTECRLCHFIFLIAPKHQNARSRRRRHEHAHTHHAAN